MRETGIVISVSEDGERANVRVARKGACAGCGSGEGCAVCGSGEGVFADVINRAGAREGDRVEIEMKTSIFITYTALVFLAPLASGMASYAAASALTDSNIVKYGVSLACFIGSIFLIYGVLNRKTGKNPAVIVSVRHDLQNNKFGDKN